MPFTILFEDDYFLAAEKPPGWPSQPTLDKKRPDFFTAFKKQVFEEERCRYLALHHRLDRDTSGVLLFAKTKEANKPLAELFKLHQVQKTYLCLTQKAKSAETFEVRNYLAPQRDPKLKKIKMISVKAGGDSAITFFRRLQEFKRGLLLQAQPKTGRMHQIRVHLAEKDLGIFGDDIYPCAKTPAARRLMLHASRLEFIHPFTKAEIKIESPLPEDFLAFEKMLNL